MPSQVRRADIARRQVLVLDASRQLRIYVLIVKQSWSTKNKAKIHVESVCAPKRASTAFGLDLTQGASTLRFSVSVETDGQG